MGKLKIAAFDPGLHLGWAICEDGRIVESGVEDFTPARGESPGMRFLRLRAFLARMWEMAGPLEVVAYESGHLRGAAATELIVGITTRLTEWAAYHGAEVARVHSGTLKKVSAHGGRASKEQMRQAAETVVGRPIASDDEADAILVAKWAWTECGHQAAVVVRHMEDARGP